MSKKSNSRLLAQPHVPAKNAIEVLGVQVHNLKNIDVTIPHGQWLAICGPSGSGKTSLALDTLYAEGQRRYIESFSAYTRQYLDVMEKPNAREIRGIPPAIAVTRAKRSTTGRATVGSTTETLDYLREVFAKISTPICDRCHLPAQRFTSDDIADRMESLPNGGKAVIGFTWTGGADSWPHVAQHLLLAGFARVSVDGALVELAHVIGGDASMVREQSPVNSELPLTLALEEAGWRSVLNPLAAHPNHAAANAVKEEIQVDSYSLPKKKSASSTRTPIAAKSSKTKKKTNTQPASLRHVSYTDRPGPSTDASPQRRSSHFDGTMIVDVIVDRVVAGSTARPRWIESLETAMAFGGKTFVWLDDTPTANASAADSSTRNMLPNLPPGDRVSCLGRAGWRWNFSDQLQCSGCNQTFPLPTPPMFSYNSPAGACPTCEGFGSVSRLDIKLIVPDPSKSIRQGAIAPLSTPKYLPKLKKLISIADEIDLPVDVPFSELTPAQVDKVWQGSKAHRFGGLNGFFQWLEKRKYKMHYRIFLARWRSYFPCTACQGRRLSDKTLQFKVDGRSIADVCELKLSDALPWLRQLTLSESQVSAVRTVMPQVTSRMQYLCDVGLSYLSLQRTLRTLSGGELQRTALTTALGSSLVNMLYVLDEPSVGLHPRDIQRLTAAIKKLHTGGNTVVTVEHEPAMLSQVQRIIEIGPAAGTHGGQVVFDGDLAQMQASQTSVTAPFLQLQSNQTQRSTKKKDSEKTPAVQRRRPTAFIELSGATGNNLKQVDVRFPSGVLCLVTGVSGSGKSSLVRQTLYPAIANQFAEKPLDTLGYQQLEIPKTIQDVIMIDDSPIGRSPRSNPVTYLKAFEPIRKLFAATIEAKALNFTPGSFSFNVDGGRCTKCQGDGSLSIDMQFMPDVYMQCPECQGTRYQKELLTVTVRDKNIHDVLQMTVREAFGFFRGEHKIQSNLKPLIDVGLEYLTLGQGSPTLSAGESQRLKLAAFLSGTKKKPTLFVLDEPTTGLHPSDIEKLLECFNALLDVGHSMIVIEHNVQMMAAADYIVDIGPESAEAGGQVVVAGSPEEIVQSPDSITGACLAEEIDFWNHRRRHPVG